MEECNVRNLKKFQSEMDRFLYVMNQLCCILSLLVIFRAKNYAFGMSTTTTTTTTAGQELDQLVNDHWLWKLEQFPEFATGSGVHTFNDRLRSLKEETFAAQKEQVEKFVMRASRIDRSALKEEEKITLDVLRDMMDR